MAYSERRAEAYQNIVCGLSDFVFAYLAATPAERAKFHSLGVSATEAAERLRTISDFGSSLAPVADAS